MVRGVASSVAMEFAIRTVFNFEMF